MILSSWWGAISERIPPEVTLAMSRLKERGFEVYLIGGAPRDLLKGKMPQDWDLATSAHPAQVEEAFSETVPLGKKYGTVQVIINDLVLEVTTYRREGAYSDGRRPDWVLFTPSLEEDLARRDFTINAIALDPLERRLVDPFGGRRDLRRRIIRTVGRPEVRFAEDALRMLRFYRFQAELNLRGAKETEEAINSALLSKVSPERIREELNRILLSLYPIKGLQGLARYSLLAEVIPEFSLLLPEKKILEHIFATVETIRAEASLRWAAFLHDLGKGSTKDEDEKGVHFYGHEIVGAEQAVKILDRFRFPRRFQEKTITLIRNHMFSTDPMITDAALRRLVTRVGKENIRDLLELRRADIIATGRDYHRAWESFSLFSSRVEALLAEERVFTLRDLAIDGHDIMEALKIPPGPRVGEAQRELFQWVLEDPGRNSKERLLGYLKEKY